MQSLQFARLFTKWLGQETAKWT